MKTRVPGPHGSKPRRVICRLSDLEFDHGRPYAPPASPSDRWRNRFVEEERSFRLDVLRAAGLMD